MRAPSVVALVASIAFGGCFWGGPGAEAPPASAGPAPVLPKRPGTAEFTRVYQSAPPVTVTRDEQGLPADESDHWLGTASAEELEEAGAITGPADAGQPMAAAS